MGAVPVVSAIIPTYNRRELVMRAIRSALAQTRAVEEDLVVDDGSTDGTGEALAAEFGRPHRLRSPSQCGRLGGAQPRHGDGARTIFCLLDSDDEWMPEKTARQLEFLETHADFGMVLCDVERVDREGRPIDRFRRREVIPKMAGAGWTRFCRIRHWPRYRPCFVAEVVADIGGFDETLATAEDLDFHLRVASKWPIGVVDEVLARAIRGHDGLSSLARTYDDYTRVIERAVATAENQVPLADRQRALAAALPAQRTRRRVRQSLPRCLALDKEGQTHLKRCAHCP
jgi:hypothetical protein